MIYAFVNKSVCNHFAHSLRNSPNAVKFVCDGQSSFEKYPSSKPAAIFQPHTPPSTSFQLPLGKLDGSSFFLLFGGVRNGSTLGENGAEKGRPGHLGSRYHFFCTIGSVFDFLSCRKPEPLRRVLHRAGWCRDSPPGSQA